MGTVNRFANRARNIQNPIRASNNNKPLTRGCVPVIVIDAQAEVPAKSQVLNDVMTHVASDRNIAHAEHPVALATQDPNADESILIWNDVRQAAAQPRK